MKTIKALSFFTGKYILDIGLQEGRNRCNYLKVMILKKRETIKLNNPIKVLEDINLSYNTD